MRSTLVERSRGHLGWVTLRGGTRRRRLGHTSTKIWLFHPEVESTGMGMLRTTPLMEHDGKWLLYYMGNSGVAVKDTTPDDQCRSIAMPSGGSTVITNESALLLQRISMVQGALTNH